MDIKKRYRAFVLCCLVLDFLVVLWLGYRYLDRKIPDEIHMYRGQEKQVEKVLDYPLVTVENAITVSSDGSYQLPVKIMGVIPFKEVKVLPGESTSVYVSGNTVGIYMETEGVMIIDTGEILSEEGTKEEPARDMVKPGDYIVTFNQQEVRNKKDLIEDLTELKEQNVVLGVMRDGQNIPVSLTPVKDTEGKYRLGIWVRDDTQGIGTLTYVDKNGRFGALGHGISDVDTGSLLKVGQGRLYQAEILGIQKGTSGNPGELAGLIRYEPGKVIGSVSQNSEKGIYGIYSGSTSAVNLQKMEIAYKQELETGPASVLCCVDGEVKEYEAEITKIDMNHEDSNKSFVIHITDPDLLDLTGGIVQGMSGSPVIQNGKFVGAVTHVFVQDATTGYGIFAETMVENEKNQ
nr:SpoIVB peptidase [uncultured Blautia sp.]